MSIRLFCAFFFSVENLGSSPIKSGGCFLDLLSCFITGFSYLYRFLFFFLTKGGFGGGGGGCGCCGVRTCIIGESMECCQFVLYF